MKAATFEYVRATSVDQVVRTLAEDEDAKILAGGQSLVPLLNMRLARPTTVIDITRIDDLSYVRRANGHVEIGALTTHRLAETSELVRRNVPLLAEALRYVGHVTIRNRGTIGGSIAHADPAAELPATCVALDAELVVQGPHGQRVIAAADFFQGYLMTAIEPEEVITEVRVPVLAQGTGCAVEELARRSGDFALVAVFATMTIGTDGTCQDARITVAGAGPAPVRATGAEALLKGAAVTPDVISAAARAAADATDPPNDIHGPAEYRREMAAVLSRRAITKATNRANGGV
ncbi:xanthine dehydrogenase family protein subunit M [Haloechinothrix salitolerans]|uniref:Xanthine dehydrogenase family protein subunit M n=1 Tax=Haloechinothrix salitolerans TaxID=926830 RepID=A0ABW2BX03_9PSEU